MATPPQEALAWPRGGRLIRIVLPELSERTNTSARPLVSLETRLLADELKATFEPLWDSEGSRDSAFPCRPAGADTRADGHSGVQIAHEHVAHLVAVLGHEVGGERLERNERAVARDRRCVRAQVALSVRTPHARARHAQGGHVDDEHVGRTVGVAGYEIARAGHEGDSPPVGADRRRARVPVRLDPTRSDAHSRRDARGEIPDEDVVVGAAVAIDEVRGRRHECDATAICAQRRAARVAVAQHAGAGDTHRNRTRRGEAATEDVPRVVGVGRDQVGAARSERHELAAAADRRPHRRTVRHGTRTRAAHAQHLGRAGVTHEHVRPGPATCRRDSTRTTGRRRSAPRSSPSPSTTPRSLATAQLPETRVVRSPGPAANAEVGAPASARAGGERDSNGTEDGGMAHRHHTRLGSVPSHLPPPDASPGAVYARATLLQSRLSNRSIDR